MFLASLIRPFTFLFFPYLWFGAGIIKSFSSEISLFFQIILTHKTNNRILIHNLNSCFDIHDAYLLNSQSVRMYIHILMVSSVLKLDIFIIFECAS